MPTHPVTRVCLEHTPERSAWGYVVVKDGKPVHQGQGVSCHPERAEMWLLLAILSDTEDEIDLVVGGHAHVLNRLERHVNNSNRINKTHPHYDLLAPLKTRRANRTIKWQALSAEKEMEFGLKEHTVSALKDYGLSFQAKDIDYITSELSKPAEPVRVRHEKISKGEDAPVNHKPAAPASQIVGYIDGIGENHLSAWAFVLFDNQSGHALIRSSGIRMPHTSTIPILASIELFSSLQQSNLSIEIRCTQNYIVNAFSQPVPDKIDSGWLKSNSLSDADAPHIWHLSSLLKEHTVRWLLVEHPHRNSLTLMMQDLAERSLVALNTGKPHQFEHRMKKNQIS
jgi:hypothetical protein